MKIKQIVAIELNTSNAKVALLSYEEGVKKVLALGSTPLSKDSIETKADQLKELLKELKVSTPYSIVCLPRSHVTSRILKLPSTDLKELQDIISFQTTKLVPFSKDEVILDYNVLESSEEGFSVVHVLLCPKNWVQEALQVLEKNGLDALSVRLSTQETTTFMAHCQKLNVPLSKETLFIEPDAETTQMFVQENEKLIFSRSINLTTKELKENPSQSLERLSTEIKKTLTLFEKEVGNIALKRITFLNFPSNIDSPFTAKVASILSLPIELEHPESSFLKNLKKIRSVYKIPKEEISFSSLLGVAQNLEKSHVNFLPKSFDKKIEQQINRNIFFKMALLITGVILSACGFLYLKNIEVDHTIAKFKNRTQQTKSLAKELIAKEKKVLLVQKQQTPQNFSLNILSEVYKIIPKEISLDSLTYDTNKGVFLKGTAFTLSDAVNLIPKFEQSPIFETVISKGTTTKKIKSQVYTDFQLELPFTQKSELND